jgi:Fe-S cluster assembly ATP-binding protein
MGEDMLEIKDLSVSVENKEILHEINLQIRPGETHVLFGPNGAGKSTLLSAIMGFPKYKIVKGTIIFNGQDITKSSLDERARLGIGISIQRPPVIRGVKTYDMLAATLKKRGGLPGTLALSLDSDHYRGQRGYDISVHA